MTWLHREFVLIFCLANDWASVDTHYGCQKMRSVFRVHGMYNFGTVFASRTTCAISVKGGETFTYSERNNGAGWLYLQQKLREKFHIHEYIRQPNTEFASNHFLQKMLLFISRIFKRTLESYLSIVLLIVFGSNCRLNTDIFWECH